MKAPKILKVDRASRNRKRVRIRGEASTTVKVAKVMNEKRGWRASKAMKHHQAERAAVEIREIGSTGEK